MRRARALLYGECLTRSNFFSTCTGPSAGALVEISYRHRGLGPSRARTWLPADGTSFFDEARYSQPGASYIFQFMDNKSMGLEIAFQSKQLRAICESPAKAKRELGDSAASNLRRHLADLEAVETVAELSEIGLEFERYGDKLGSIRFGLGGGRHLYCDVNHHHMPMNGEAVDWTKVTRLKVIQIGGEL